MKGSKLIFFNSNISSVSTHFLPFWFWGTFLPLLICLHLMLQTLFLLPKVVWIRDQTQWNVEEYFLGLLWSKASLLYSLSFQLKWLKNIRSQANIFILIPISEKGTQYCRWTTPWKPRTKLTSENAVERQGNRVTRWNIGHSVQYAFQVNILKMIYCLSEIQIWLGTVLVFTRSGNPIQNTLY